MCVKKFLSPIALVIMLSVNLSNGIEDHEDFDKSARRVLKHYVIISSDVMGLLNSDNNSTAIRNFGEEYKCQLMMQCPLQELVTKNFPYTYHCETTDCKQLECREEPRVCEIISLAGSDAQVYCASPKCQVYCEGDRCSASGTGDESLSKCKAPHCKTECTGASCRSYTMATDNGDATCKGSKCVADCKGANCVAECTGDGCEAQCSGYGCSTLCSGALCKSTCTALQCSADCHGHFCHAFCGGENCRSTCEGTSCARNIEHSVEVTQKFDFLSGEWNQWNVDPDEENLNKVKSKKNKPKIVDKTKFHRNTKTRNQTRGQDTIRIKIIDDQTNFNDTERYDNARLNSEESSSDDSY